MLPFLLFLEPATFQLLFSFGIALAFACLASFADSFAWRVLRAFYRPSRKKIPNKWKYILSPHSFCENCQNKIPLLRLIPIIGILMANFRCGECGKKISPRFFWIETAAFAYGFLMSYLHVDWNYMITLSSGNSLALHSLFGPRLGVDYILFSMFYFVIGYVIAMIDFEVLLIPTEAIFFFMLLGFFETFLLGENIHIHFLIAFFWMGLFWLLRILSRYKMGFADVVLVFALSLGLFPAKQIALPTLASLLGIGFYLGKRFQLKGQKMNPKLPFGTFLVLAFLLLRILT